VSRLRLGCVSNAFHEPKRGPLATHLARIRLGGRSTLHCDTHEQTGGRRAQETTLTEAYSTQKEETMEEGHNLVHKARPRYATIGRFQNIVRSTHCANTSPWYAFNRSHTTLRSIGLAIALRIRNSSRMLIRLYLHSEPNARPTFVQVQFSRLTNS
jgi:hypothetical protein